MIIINVKLTLCCQKVITCFFPFPQAELTEGARQMPVLVEGEGNIWLGTEGRWECDK